MKVSTGSILVGNNIETAILNDSTLEPTEVIVWLRGTYGGVPCTLNGYQDDSGLKTCRYNSSTSITHPIVVNNGTKLLEGYVSLFDTGEIEFTFTTRITGNSYTLEYLAIER